MMCIYMHVFFIHICIFYTCETDILCFCRRAYCQDLKFEKEKSIYVPLHTDFLFFTSEPAPMIQIEIERFMI